MSSSHIRSASALSARESGIELGVSSRSFVPDPPAPPSRGSAAMNALGSMLGISRRSTLTIVSTGDKEPDRTIHIHKSRHEVDSIAHQSSNRIRTAKYTPLTFLPINLWVHFISLSSPLPARIGSRFEKIWTVSSCGQHVLSTCCSDPNSSCT